MKNLDFELVEKTCCDYGLKMPERDLKFTGRFIERLGHLRDKEKYSFNRKGEMDFQSHELTTLVSRARFSIGVSIVCQKAGLASFWAPGIGGQYFPARQDWLFFYFVDSAYSNLYDAWGRIANILCIFWPPPSANTKIYFKPTVERILGEIDPVPDSLTRLVTFKDSEYTDLINNHRKEIVHTRSTQGSYFERFLHQPCNEGMLTDLEQERDRKPEILISNYSRLLVGMDEMVELIYAGFPKISL